MSLGADVVAAGAVITRRGGSEVLLVHRPKYDDWSFPKGKQDPGEHVLHTAVREVHEETGLAVHLGRQLPSQYYEISGGRSKVVNYWVARVDRSQGHSPFQPNNEVDERRWFALPEAAQHLSYLDDVAVLDAFREQPRRTHALMIVRHAAAQKRATWTEADTARPLTGEGQSQASVLASALAAYGIADLYSSPSARCVETLSPYGEPQAHDELSEEGADATRIADLMRRLLQASQSAVVCSHRPVLPEIFTSIGISEEPLAPAEFVVCHHRSGQIVAVERHLSR